MVALKSTLQSPYKMQKGTENKMISHYEVNTNCAMMNALPTQDF